MKNNVLFHRKDFINKEGHLSDASISSNVLKIQYGGTDGYSTELKIRDCDKAVYLDIELDDRESRENSVYKLTVLIVHLNELRDFILTLKDDEQTGVL